MENLIKRQRRALQQHHAFPASSLLDLLFKPLQRLTTEDLLLHPVRNELIDWHIHNSINKWQYDRLNPTQRDFLLLQALHTARRFLYQSAGLVPYIGQGRSRMSSVLTSRAAKRGSLRYTIYFLYAAAYLGIKPTEVIEYFELSGLATRQLAQMLAQRLQGIAFRPKPPSNAQAHELANFQRATKSANEGFAQRRLKDAYKLIEALEYGGSGVYIAFPASGIIQLLAAVSYTHFRQTLQRQTTPYSIALYLEGQPINLLQQLSQDETIRDPWLLVELLRRFVATERRDQSAPSSIQTSVFQLLNRLCQIDIAFFKQAAEYFRNSQAANTALGSLLASWPVTDALMLLQTTLGIDSYNLAQAQRFSLLKAYSHCVSKEQLIEFLAGAFAMWERHLGEFEHNRSEDLFNALRTDYWDYVLDYYKLTRNEERLMAELFDAYEQVRWLHTDWHIDTTKFIKSFYLKFTKLFALSIAYRMLQLDNPDARKLADIIEADLTFAAIELRHDETHFAELLANLRD